ncbi:hypothetical protein BC827DRAFT_1124567 [Russula dissimulans]|nr:hypothetical protein BC827DRAFT_1124567 [Russula dissimulans]
MVFPSAGPESSSLSTAPGALVSTDGLLRGCSTRHNRPVSQVGGRANKGDEISCRGWSFKLQASRIEKYGRRRVVLSSSLDLLVRSDSALYAQTLHNLVTSSYVKPSTALSHISPRDERIAYESEERAKISEFPTAKELRQARDVAVSHLTREDEAENVGMKRKSQVSSRPSKRVKASDDNVIDNDVYFRVNYDRFNIHIRNKLIESAARERFNDGTAIVLRGALKATESEQNTLSEVQSASTTAANISTHLEDDRALKSGLVLNTKKPKDITLVKAYLSMLAFVDNPTPAGKASSFVSFSGSKVYVEFEIIASRLRRRALEAVTRERHGHKGVRILRLLLGSGKVDEKQVSKLAMIAPKDVRPLLSAMTSESLISIQEVPKSADRNPTRMFYLWLR